MAVEVKTIMTAEDRASAVFSKSMKNLQATTDKLFTLNGIMAQGLTALTKLAGGFGAVEVACKAFNAIVMEGSQTTGDFVRNGVGALNDTLGILARSLSTCDFSALNQGLLKTYENAVKLRQQLDGLNDMVEATNYFKSKYTAQLSEAREVLGDPASSAEDIAKAIRSGDDAIGRMKRDASNLSKELEKTATDMLNLQSGVGGSTVELIERLEAIKLNPEKEEQEKVRARKLVPQQSDYQIKAVTYSPSMVPMISTTNDVASYTRAFNEAMKDADKAAAQQELTFLELGDTERKQLIGYLQSLQDEGTAMSALTRQWNRQKKTALKGISSTSAGSIGKASASVTSSLEMKDFAPKPLQQDQTESMNSLLAMQKDLQASLGDVTNYIDYKEITDELAEVQRMIDAQPLALRLGIDTSSAVDIQGQFDSLAASLQGSMAQSLSDLTGSLDDAAGSSKKVSKEGKENKDSWKLAAQSVSQLGSALQGVDNKGVNIAGIIMEAVANVALGFATALASPANGAGGVFTWIAAAVSGLATMTATIVSIKKATSGSYAEGGIVPGTYNGGVDNTYVYASPGEVILNRAQQQNLLAQLDNNNGNSGSRTVVRGEQIVTALNNYGRRKGYGEVAWQ